MSPILRIYHGYIAAANATLHSEAMAWRDLHDTVARVAKFKAKLAARQAEKEVP